MSCAQCLSLVVVSLARHPTYGRRATKPVEKKSRHIEPALFARPAAAFV
jgi:hypothetical protein